MTEPRRFLNRVLAFLAVTAILAGLAYNVLWRAFMHNPALNGLILGVLLVGIVYSIRRILILRPEVEWIEHYRSGRTRATRGAGPRLLRPLVSVLAEQDRRGRTALSALSMRHFLDSISARLDETRDIARYQTGLLIFLGLLGTFWGLLETIHAVAGVIGELELASRDLAGVFGELKAGLTAPLSGMGTAFSSSLFGLAGSLVLGFIDLQATQAQNSFYNDVEEWLTSFAQHGVVEGDSSPRPAFAASQPLPAYVEALLQQTAENLERMERTFARAEAGREQFQVQLGMLAQALADLGERLDQDRKLLGRIVDTQRTLARQLAEEDRTLVLDEVTRKHLANIDSQLRRLSEEIVRGRESTLRELRNEIKLVARTIAIAAGEPQTLIGE